MPASAEEIDAALDALILLGLRFEATKLQDIERARLQLALADRSEEVQMVLEAAASSLVPPLCQALCDALNALALSPEKRD